MHLGRWRSASSQVTPLYNGGVIRQRATTVAEWAERMHSAEPPTEDDVTVLLDGRRLDSRESVESWLRELEALRRLEAATDDANK
jgi:hypothetical protein